MSRFRNASPRIPRKENTISELPIKSNDITFGNSIVCNSERIYFSLGGNEIGILPLREQGKKQQSIPRFSASSSPISSLASTFLNSNIFSTASDSEGCKIWEKTSENLSDQKMIRKIDAPDNSKIRTMAFHPSTSEVIGVVSTSGLSVHDITQPDHNVRKLKLMKDAPIGSLTALSWRADGSTIGCIDDAGNLHFLDPRNTKTHNTSQIGLKNARVVWSGNTPYILVTGVEKATNRRLIMLFDSRKHETSLIKRDLDSCTGYAYPVHDPDTNIIVVASKGDNLAHFCELESGTLSSVVSYRFDDYTHGICSIPRTSLDVMSCEVMKVMQLNKSSISPVSYICTRKSYTTYYPELFPDADDTKQSLDARKYFKNQNNTLAKVSLAPQVLGSPNAQSSGNNENNETEEEDGGFNVPSFLTDTELYSKFRNIKGFKLHREFQHDLPGNVDSKTSPESNGLAVNKDTLAIPLKGGTGKIGILRLCKPGRVAEPGPFFIENKSPVCDFDIDKKDDYLLASVCDDAAINLWKIPVEGLTDNMLTSTHRIPGTSERATSLKFHPCASDVISTSTIDGALNIWDVNNSSCMCTCKLENKALILCQNWNDTGSLICSVCNDKKIYIFDPRSGQSPSFSTSSFEGTGPGRVLFVRDNVLLVSGFVAHGHRIIGTKDTRKPNELLAKIELDNAPSVLIPHYDPDTKIAYMSGRGDSSVLPIEVRDDAIGLFELPKYVTIDPHCAFSLLRKDQCNIKDVEVAKVIRLMKTNTELVSFNVVRVRQEYFQDDLFPPTRMVWKASMTANDWKNRNDKAQDMFDLKPEGMERLTEASISNNAAKKYNSRKELKLAQKKVDQKTDNDFLGFVMGKAKLREEDPIVQDERQGIDDSEWD